MLQKSTTQKVLEIFFREPTKAHYLKEISRKTDTAHTSIAPILERLTKLNLIKKHIEKRGTRDFPVYLADLQQPTHKFLKRIYNIHSVMESGLAEKIIIKTSPGCIFLFGSCSRGEDTEESDIDIFIEAEKTDIDLRQYEKILGRRIQLLFNEDFSKLPKELKNNIINGVKLHGFLEAF